MGRLTYCGRRPRRSGCGCKGQPVTCLTCGQSYVCCHNKCVRCGSYHTRKGPVGYGITTSFLFICLDCGKEWAS